MASASTSSALSPTASRCGAVDAPLPVMVSASFARGVNRGVKRYSGLPTLASFRKLSQVPSLGYNFSACSHSRVLLNVGGFRVRGRYPWPPGGRATAGFALRKGFLTPTVDPNRTEPRTTGGGLWRGRTAAAREAAHARGRTDGGRRGTGWAGRGAAWKPTATSRGCICSQRAGARSYRT